MEKNERAYECPDLPGVYFEAIGKNIHCQSQTKKHFIHIGFIKSFNVFQKLVNFHCKNCLSLFTLENIAFQDCQWFYTGEALTGEKFKSKVFYAKDYTTCKDLSENKWKWLKLFSKPIPEENKKIIAKIQSALYEDFTISEPCLIKKRKFDCLTNSKDLENELDKRKRIIALLKSNMATQEKVIKELAQEVLDKKLENKK
ncbi:hypothetical protein SteCoe_11060 [Stentor coeruleus]|uniref:Uncharacterized protein n=1 Tax=Stentor coeruleus TaxID=5963 RepID=A0A1R2CE26_9CILI|nr:hypothetical protein SteCoe_11060 [Stentor coeruleus]